MQITVEVDEIRSIYRELIGYILEAPTRKDYIDQNGHITEAQFWDSFNNTILELNIRTQNNYNRYNLIPKQTNSGRTFYIDVDFYRSNLSSLIHKIHSDFFNDEPLPISELDSGQITFNQSITQNQSVSINIFKQSIEDKLQKYEEGTKERSFLKKLNDYLSTTSNITDIFRNALSMAKGIGLSSEDVTKIFS